MIYRRRSEHLSGVLPRGCHPRAKRCTALDDTNNVSTVLDCSRRRHARLGGVRDYAPGQPGLDDQAVIVSSTAGRQYPGLNVGWVGGSQRAVVAEPVGPTGTW